MQRLPVFGDRLLKRKDNSAREIRRRRPNYARCCKPKSRKSVDDKLRSTTKQSGLKKVYGAPGPSAPPQSGPARHRHSSDPRAQSAYHQSQPSTYTPAPAAWGSYNAGPYMSGGYASQSTFLTPMQQQQHLKNKSSIFSFRRSSEQDQHKLGRKRSAVF